MSHKTDAIFDPGFAYRFWVARNVKECTDQNYAGVTNLFEVAKDWMAKGGPLSEYRIFWAYAFSHSDTFQLNAEWSAFAVQCYAKA